MHVCISFVKLKSLKWINCNLQSEVCNLNQLGPAELIRRGEEAEVSQAYFGMYSSRELSVVGKDTCRSYTVDRLSFVRCNFELSISLMGILQLQSLKAIYSQITVT